SVFSYTGSPYCLSDPDPAPVLTPGGVSGTWTASPPGLVINSTTGVIDLSASTPGNYVITNTIPATASCPSVFSTYPIEISTGPIVSIDPSAATICDGGSVVLTVDAAPSTGDCTPTTFTNTTDYIIEDHPGPITYSPITVSGITPSVFSSAMIESVCINILHAWDDDLDISLISPSGTTMKLSFDNGGSGDNYTNTCFVVSGAPAITSGAAPFTGNFTPQQPFSLLDGDAVNGVWQLKVDDDLGGFGGTLLDWSITFLCTNEIESYTWSPATGLSSTTSATVTASPVTTTTYSVTVTETAGCSTTATSTVTVTGGAAASFTFVGSPYCQDDTDPIPVLSPGATAGTWTASPSGLIINSTTGLIDLSASTPGVYVITNTIAATASCPAVSATYTITITPADDAAFSYASSTYCLTGTDPVPVISGVPGGVFSGTGVVFVSTA
ncbi:MAG: proprotein convertase P-domain-containing protein, partial [Chitinophagales bacterium]